MTEADSNYLPPPFPLMTMDFTHIDVMATARGPGGVMWRLRGGEAVG
jgi:hypothetical protein